MRNRAYGGKAGIWLKKRKRQVVPNAGDIPSSQQHKKVIPVQDGVMEDQRNSITRTLIGWDDVRCRPIYKEASEATATSDGLDDEPMEQAVEFTHTEISDEDDHTPDLSTEESSGFNVSSEPHVSKKARAYGSRKRANPPDEDHVERNHVERKRAHVSTAVNKGRVASTLMPMVTPSNNHIPYDLVTPQRVFSSICSALNSDTKATPLGRSVDDDVSFGVTEHKKEEQKKKVFAFGRKKGASSRRGSTLPVLAELDFVDKVNVPLVGQPSSSTSLDAAKAFFERLDSQQKLTLDASDTPGKACVRTRRAIHVQSHGIRQEYEQYAAATKASGVDPLSMEQYARNRVAFFRTGDMFDGFLDE
jgi:hypothetical protein